MIPIIIPAYEPDERLIELLKTLDGVGPDGSPRRIILVNDGSSSEYDSVFSRAESMIEANGGVLLKHEVNRGKGAALKTAFAYIIANIPSAIGVVTADSDGQHTVSCIDSVSEVFEKNPSCLILGVRSFDGDDIPWKSSFGNKLTMKVLKFVSGLSVSDTQTGLRGIPMAFMKELVDFGGDRFEFETEMLLETVGRYEIKEVTIETIYESKENHQTHFNPIKDSIKIYKILGRQFFRYIVASVCSFVLDILLFYIFCRIFSGFGAYIAISTVVARVFSSTFNFLINYKKVFRSQASVAGAALRYFALVVVQMAASAALVTLFVRLIGCNEVVVKVIVDTILFFISFKVQQMLVFKKG